MSETSRPRPSAAARLLFGAMAVAAPLVLVKAATSAPPVELRPAELAREVRADARRVAKERTS